MISEVLGFLALGLAPMVLTENLPKSLSSTGLCLARLLVMVSKNIFTIASM